MAEASRVVGTAHCMHNRCSIPVAVVEVHFLRLQNTHDIPQCHTEHRALACGTSDLACGGPGGKSEPLIAYSVMLAASHDV